MWRWRGEGDGVDGFHRAAVEADGPDGRDEMVTLFGQNQEGQEETVGSILNLKNELSLNLRLIKINWFGEAMPWTDQFLLL